MFVLRRIYHGLGDFDSQVDRYVKSTDNKYVLIKASRIVLSKIDENRCKQTVASLP